MPTLARLGIALLMAAGAAAPAVAEDVPIAVQEAPAQEPVAEAFTAYVAVTKADEVRVRAGPSANFRVLERLPKGAWVVVTGVEGEFQRVRVPGGVPVFVHADLVEASPDGKTAVVTKSDVLLRPTAGQEYFPLEGQKLQKGDEVAVLGAAPGEKGEKDRWLRVLPPARTEYFIHASLLEKVAAEGERAEELARVELERRDAYTGGKEAEAAREAVRRREDGFAKAVEAAGAALAAAPAAALPEGAEAERERLTEVLTESGDPAVRARAAKLSRDYVEREREMRVARAKAEKEAVSGELERRLAEVEAEYRRRLDEILKAAPRPAGPKYDAVGTVRKSFDGFELVKGAVVLHRVESLRYDLDEFVGLRVGVKGQGVTVDAAKGLALFRVDGIEILE